MPHKPFSRRARNAGLALATSAITSLALSAPALAITIGGGGGPGGPTPGTSSFVIGDQNVAVGAHVTFWGAQWWKDNPLSTGSAPASFKGYADSTPTTCGQSWTTDPGNSSDPPATVDPFIDVIVASQITKSGSVISGDTQEIVEVQTDPGYAGDPGHAGTGTIVDIVCGG